MPRPLVPALLALLLGALALPAAAGASAGQVMTFEAPSELIDDRTRDATLAEVQSLGVSRVRALVYWRSFSVQPTARTAPAFDTSDHLAYPQEATWGRLDRLVDAVRARGMSVQLTLTGPVPKWATRRKRDYVSEPDAALFGRWVRAVATRYGDRVDLWSVWNEPNHPDFLAPQFRQGTPTSPAIYRRLYQAAERELHGVPGGARDVVLFGETAPIGNRNVVAPLAFLRRAMCLSSRYKKSRGCDRLDIDGYAHHPYSFRAAGPFFRSKERDEVSIASLDRLGRALDRAARAGAIAPNRPIYLTEFGVQSHPDRTAGVAPRRQAEYLAIAERIAYANPRVKAFSQYLLRDDRPRSGPRIKRYSGFETGLRYASGRRKPSYNGFRLPLAATRYGSRDVLWGRVRGATASVDVTIEHALRDRWRRLTVVPTSPSGVFGFGSAHRKGQRYRVRWERPDGSTLTGPPIRVY